MEKSDKFNEVMDPARVALLLGLSVGLGIVVHEGFFLVAVGALAVATVHAVQEHSGSAQFKAPHR